VLWTPREIVPGRDALHCRHCTRALGLISPSSFGISLAPPTCASRAAFFGRATDRSVAPGYDAAQAPLSEGAQQPNSHATTSKSQVQQLRCCCYYKPVSHPFWVCINCVEDIYICKDCDAKRVPAKRDGVNPAHKLSHPLVELFDNEPIPEAQVTDVTLMELKTRMSELEAKFAALETKLESRFASLEAILHGREEKLLTAA